MTIIARTPTWAHNSKTITVTVVMNPIIITILMRAVITTPPTSAPTACAASAMEESIYHLIE